MLPQPRRKKSVHPARHPDAGKPARTRRKTARRRPDGPPARPRVAGQSSRPSPEGERLQKILAAAGHGSRRECEELITSGRIEVDRKVVTELGTRVDPQKQEIRVDGETLRPPRLAYFAVNKPPGVISTNRDQAGRPRVIDLVPGQKARLFTVGRLDLNSDGLILLTNDGELANRLTHPRYGVRKTYRVLVAGEPTPEELQQLEQGVRLAEGVARVDAVKIRGKQGKATRLEIVLSEGKNREIRRILARTGHKVMRLTRIAVGPIKLGKLQPGEHRRLTSQEVDELWNIARRTGRD
jgi:23S rRNA pseudouridine2605 synthase